METWTDGDWRSHEVAAWRDQVLAAREDVNAFIEYIGDGTGASIIQEDAHREWQALMDAERFLVIHGPIGTGKALPIDTPIAVPGGWKLIGDLEVGDVVIGGDGVPTRVSYVSQIWNDHDVFEFEFDDGTSIRSDADHQWSAWTVHDRSGGRPPRTVTTRQIIDRFRTPGGLSMWRIPLTGAVEHPHRDLVVDPYVLGVWLGDGDSNGARITCHIDDAEIVDRCIELEGGRCGKRTFDARTSGVFTQVVGGVTDKHASLDERNLRGRLRRLGVLGNKHIPQDYLTASKEQRLDLLRGLMDTDGYIDRRGVIEFCTTSENIAVGVLELARSLGVKPVMTAGRATIKGVDKGPKYRVCWSNPLPVFNLSRKANRLQSWIGRRSAQAESLAVKRGRKRMQRNTWDCRVITGWRQVERVPVRCIAVEAAHHTFVATRQYILTHNTTQVRGRLLFEIGKDPDRTFIAYVSASEDHPKKQAASMMEMIEKNVRLRHVFPRLAKSRERWSPKAFKVDRGSMAPEPTMQVYGLYGNILGARKNIILIDDICTFINTLTKASREKMAGWMSSVLSRLKGEVKVICIGHIWADDDLLMTLVRKHGFAYARYEAIRTREDGSEEPVFPRVLPADKIRELWDLLGPIFGEMMLLNRMPKSTTSRFPMEWFLRALEAGRGTSFWTGKLYPCEVVTGVDLGHKKKAGKDLTVMVSVALEEDARGRPVRRVIDVRAGRWKGPEIIQQMQELRMRFSTTFYVEDNGGQQYIVDFAEDDALYPVPVYGSSTTGSGSQGKYDMRNGVEGAIGGELKLGMWIFPCDQETLTPPQGIGDMIQGALAYQPTQAEDHTSDYLMAWWYAWKGAEQMRPRRGLPEETNVMRR